MFRARHDAPQRAPGSGDDEWDARLCAGEWVRGTDCEFGARQDHVVNSDQQLTVGGRRRRWTAGVQVVPAAQIRAVLFWLRIRAICL